MGPRLKDYSLRFETASGKTAQELFDLLETKVGGLDLDEAKQRLTQLGPNIIKAKETRWWEILFRQFRSAFIYLLFAATLIALWLGELMNAALILLFLLINASIGFIQEYKADRSLKLLKTFLKRKTTVKRGGKEKLIPIEEAVVGDIVFLRAGDMIPADGYFLDAEGVAIDESPLTGESSPVEKIAGPIAGGAKNFYEAKNIGFFRTTLVRGEGELLIFATGNKTAVGSIARTLEETVSQSGFEIGIQLFSTFILKLVLLTVPLVFLANIAVHGGKLNVGEFLIFSIALTVSVIPEALPLVTTLSLTRGALRLAQKKVVPRRLSAIEDIGSIEVLCVDKTGTITENKLAVADIWGDRAEVIFWGLAASTRFYETIATRENVFDRALERAAEDSIKTRLRAFRHIDELSFDPLRRKESVLLEEDRRQVLVSRGAPEAIIAHYGSDTQKPLREWVGEQGGRGRRILAIAKKAVTFEEDHDLVPHDEEGAELVGLVSFADPLKPTTKQALRAAERLGVRVKVITGDSKEVAGWAAHEAGIIENPREVLTGDEFEKLPNEEKTRAIEKYDVFARTLPLQKYEILQLLQKKFLVGFLGEGFNDAPALKLAHVAIAVEGASDIAQDASDVILLNKDLDVIVEGIREGRKIFANTLKYIRATLTSNFGNFYALAFASLVIDYLPMLPIQILLLNLFSDFPMISIATDSVDEEELKKPRGYNVRDIALSAIILGLVSTAFDFTFFGFFVRHGEKTLQTMWFIGSILTELILLFSIRTRRSAFRAEKPSNIVIALTAVAALAAVLIPLLPFGQNLFSFQKPNSTLLAITFGIVGLYFVTTEIVKLWYYRMLNHGKRLNQAHQS